MITIRQKGSFKRVNNYLERVKGVFNISILDKYGKAGVDALAKATPVDTGLTASSWYYEVNRYKESVRLTFFNSNIQNGVPIAIVLQYGHDNGQGYWIEGIDYINPALKTVFTNLADEAWKEVTKV